MADTACMRVCAPPCLFQAVETACKVPLRCVETGKPRKLESFSMSWSLILPGPKCQKAHTGFLGMGGKQRHFCETLPRHLG